MRGIKSLTAIATAAIALSACATTNAQTSTAPAAQTAPTARIGGHPDINGVWQVMNTANWNL